MAKNTATDWKGQELGLTASQSRIVTLARGVVKLSGQDMINPNETTRKALERLGWNGPQLTASRIQGALADIRKHVNATAMGIANDDKSTASLAINAACKRVLADMDSALTILRVAVNEAKAAAA